MVQAPNWPGPVPSSPALHWSAGWPGAGQRSSSELRASAIAVLLTPLPQVRRKWPSGSSSWTRRLGRSTTKMFPAESKATPWVEPNCPPPSPGAPTLHSPSAVQTSAAEAPARVGGDFRGERGAEAGRAGVAARGRGGARCRRGRFVAARLGDGAARVARRDRALEDRPGGEVGGLDGVLGGFGPVAGEGDAVAVPLVGEGRGAAPAPRFAFEHGAAGAADGEGAGEQFERRSGRRWGARARG